MLLCYITILLHSNVLRMIHNTFFTVNQTDHICLDSWSAQNPQNLWVIYCLLDYLIKDNTQRKARFATGETDCQRHQRLPDKCGICPIISGNTNDADTKMEKVKLTYKIKQTTPHIKKKKKNSKWLQDSI